MTLMVDGVPNAKSIGLKTFWRKSILKCPSCGLEISDLYEGFKAKFVHEKHTRDDKEDYVKTRYAQ